MTERLDAARLRALFVDQATAKFARNVPDFVALQSLVRDAGGLFRNDHGAIRVVDDATRDRFVRCAAALGLIRDLDYEFPAKKLKSFDLQVPGEDANQFKIFVSQVDLAAFPPAVAALVHADSVAQQAGDWTRLDELAAKATRDHGLSSRDAQAFIHDFVHGLMQRHGQPIRRATLAAVAAVSGEAASALALGPDFNHLTIDVRAAGFAGIDAMAEAMTQAGFKLLPAIQGAPGTKLRQTATMAQTVPTPVLEPDGSLGQAPAEKQFVEIIERNPVTGPDGRTHTFKNFLASNAEKIFDAAATKSR